MQGHDEVATALIEAGSRVGLVPVGSSGAVMSPLQIAVIKGMPTAVQALARCGTTGPTVHRCSEAECVAGADLNERDADGMSMLHLACLHRQESSAEMLIACGAAVNERDNEGSRGCCLLLPLKLRGFRWTPLHVACAVGDTVVGSVGLLLVSRVDPNVQGYTVLRRC